jgi:hypothetical protein
MGAVQITVRVQIVVPAEPEVVWDYTQDYACRANWDPGVRRARLVGAGPPRVAEIEGPGLRCRLRYRVFERPRRTSLAMEDVRSALVVGGGGSWRYERAAGGTLWTQVNTLRLRPWLGPLAPLLRWALAAQTRRGMARARRRIVLGRTAPARRRACPA